MPLNGISRRSPPSFDDEPFTITRTGLRRWDVTSEHVDDQSPREVDAIAVTPRVIGLWTHGRIQVFGRPDLRLTGHLGAPSKLGLPTRNTLRIKLGVPIDRE